MPFYELTLVLRPMPKKELVDCLKRAANLIWQESGVLRRIEYLGYQKLAYGARSKSDETEKHLEGSFFLYHVSIPQMSWRQVNPELKLDVDIIKATFFEANNTKLPEDYECTLEEELRPPFYRQSVQPLLQNKNVRADKRSIDQI